MNYPYSKITFSSKNHEGLANFLSLLSSQNDLYSSVILVSDHQVFSLFGENLLQILENSKLPLVEPFLFSSGEPSKSLATAENCWTHMHTQGLDRKSLVVALGGGVVTDLAGFAAACYMRGIPHICIPTTLMGMADASIGGKTGVNLPSGKNLVGAFHHPVLIDISIHYLEQLPRREFHAGLAEVIKYGVIGDEKLFQFIEQNIDNIMRGEAPAIQHIVKTSCHIKADIVAKDEKESGLRSHLNFGHTFAHAIEAATHYTTYLHGEAVAIGMCCAAHLGQELGFVSETFVHRVENLIKRAELPVHLPDSIHAEQLILLMEGDKKTVSKKISLIVPKKIGKVERHSDIDNSSIKKALLKMQRKGSA